MAVLEEIVDSKVLVEDIDSFSDDDLHSQSDSLSEAGSDEEILEESMLERLQALRDIVSEEHREKLWGAWNRVYNKGAQLSCLLGNTMWVLSTSALLVVLPLAIEMEREQFYLQQEMELQASHVAQEVS